MAMSYDPPPQPHPQPRGLSTAAYSGLAIAGLAAMALVVSASAAPHADAASSLGQPGHQAPAAGTPASGTKAESLRLARKLLGKVVLPPGTRKFRGKRLPPGLGHPAEIMSADTTVDVHRAFAEKESLNQAIRFLNHHHPRGWQWDGSGSSWRTVHGKKVILEKDVSYRPRKLAPQISAIELSVEVVPGHDGHSYARADVQVIWFPARSAKEHLIASRFKSVVISEWHYGKKVRHFRKTFRQKAIIDKLTRVLNAEKASPGGVESCPAELAVYELRFTPKKGDPDASVSADGCFEYGISVGGHQQPDLVDNGKVESIAHHLMRGQANPVVHPGGPPDAR